MHQTIKTVFRSCFALVIFIVTLSLIFTCVAKVNEILHADQSYAEATTTRLHSDAEKQWVLVSNNTKPDHAIFVLMANNGYVAKIECAHYLTDICVDGENKSHRRQIQSIELLDVGQHHYIKNVSFKNSVNGQKTELKYSDAQLQQFYQTDIANLKYVIFGVALFAFAAIYVSFRIIRDFKKFLTK